MLAQLSKSNQGERTHWVSIVGCERIEETRSPKAHVQVKTAMKFEMKLKEDTARVQG